MQILPSTASRLASLMGKGEPKEEDLFDPDFNVAYGTRYLSDLLKAFGSLPLALAAYNGGPFNLKSVVEARPDLPLDLLVETLPFIETSDYVKKVLESVYLYELSYLGQANYPDLSEASGPVPGTPPDF
jgi:soluble lytic murein transglycosylase